jgi:hypothetical protein
MLTLCRSTKDHHFLCFQVFSDRFELHKEPIQVTKHDNDKLASLTYTLGTICDTTARQPARQCATDRGSAALVEGGQNRRAATHQE